ncbi:MAG: glycosyltransferase [Streptosporangiaceae bacterium]
MTSVVYLPAAGQRDPLPPDEATTRPVTIRAGRRRRDRDPGPQRGSRSRPSVRRLHAYLRDRLPFAARITIADNGSTDRTPDLAAELASELDGVSAVRLERPGRGGALREAWLASDAGVYAGRQQRAGGLHWSLAR